MRGEPRRVLSADEIASCLVEIEKSAYLAGHQPNPDALDRARRILAGEISPDEALAELLVKYVDAAEG
jgi:hypothetical protein